MVNKSITAFVLTENTDFAQKNIEQFNAYSLVRESYLVISKSNASSSLKYKTIKTISAGSSNLFKEI